VPISYDIKTEEMLRDEAIDAHTSDRFTSIMQMVHRKYAGDTDLIRVKELALMYAPLLMVQSVQELQLLLASGAYNENDLIKRDRVESVLIDLSKSMDLVDMSNDAVFALVDAALSKYITSSDVVLVDDNIMPIEGGNGDVASDLALLEAESQAKLRGTVGGVEGIVKITQAVAQRTMTESAAERLLVNIYGFSAELARQIIDVPPQPNDN
jgi:hypothetical protein